MSLNSSSIITNASKHLKRSKRITERPWLRKFCSETKNTKQSELRERKHVNQPSLNESLPGLPKVRYIGPEQIPPFTSVTKLYSGVRVASEDRFGSFCTVGVALDSGSRFECAYPSGVCHFLEKLGFQSTKKFASRSAITTELEDCGGIFDCRATRDVTMYLTSALRADVKRVMNVLGDVILRPNITDEEISNARQAVKFEIENFNKQPEQNMILQDMIHAAAFKDNTLGLPRICPEKNLDLIDKSVLLTYLKNHYVLHRSIVAGVGVDHDELVNSVKDHLVEEEPSWNDSNLIKPDSHFHPDKSVAQYTGGIVQELCDIPQSRESAGLPELAHVVIGFEGVSYEDPDFIPLSLLTMIMGGGGSFCIGGPGRGMFTRLYLNILNQNQWVHNATAYNYAYVDTGLFCVHASTTPDKIDNLTDIMIKELVAMPSKVYIEELQRAKKQLKSLLLMNLESRAVVFEDLARQTIANGFRKQPDVYLRLIDSVTHEHIKQIARRMLVGPVCVAARGKIAKLPSYSDIQSAISSADIKYVKKCIIR